MKYLIKNLYNDFISKDVLLYQAEMVSYLPEEKQAQLVKKLREIKRKEKIRINKLLSKF